MKRSRFSEEEIIGVLKEAEATTVKATCAKRNISEATYYGWRKKYGGMDVNEARRLRALEGEKGGLKRLVGDPAVQKQIPQKGKLKKRGGPQTGAGEGKHILEKGLEGAAQTGPPKG